MVEDNTNTVEAQETLFRLGNLLGKRVKTPDGEGTLVSVHTPFTGLYLVPSEISCIVWDYTQCVQKHKSPWVYRPEDVSAIE